MNASDSQVYPGAHGLQRDRYVAARQHCYGIPEPIPKNARLKEVCDNCSGAKVRCSREKAGCHRCRARGLECVYSVSRRRGRRGASERRTASVSSAVSWGSSPSLALDCTELDASPLETSLHISSNGQDKIAVDNSYLWSFGPHAEDTGVDLFIDNGLCSMQNYDLTQSFLFPMEPPDTFCGTPKPVRASKSSSIDSGPEEREQMQYDQSAGIIVDEPAMEISRSSSSSDSLSNEQDPKVDTSQIQGVYEELLGLADFAIVMEQNFDAVVRHRISRRDIPTSDADPSVEEIVLARYEDGAGGGPAKSRSGPGHLESAYYCSLAELRRRLKWLREDVGNMIVPCAPPTKGAGAIYAT